MTYSYAGKICSNLNMVSYSVNNIVSQLQRVIRDEEKIMDIKLILSELIVNGVLHGNNLSADKYIKISFEFFEGEIDILVEDEGDGIHFSFENYDPDELMSHGRGLILVKALVDDMQIEKTSVRVRKFIGD